MYDIFEKQRICMKNISNNMYDLKKSREYVFFKPRICMKPEILLPHGRTKFDSCIIEI